MGEDKKDLSRLAEKVKEKINQAHVMGKKFTVYRLVSNQVLMQESLRDKETAASPLKLDDEVEVAYVDKGWQERWRNNALSLHAEVSEALEWMPWKPWKKFEGTVSISTVFNAKMELVDCLCFLINMWYSLGGTAEELAAMHEVKAEENIDRQRRGY